MKMRNFEVRLLASCLIPATRKVGASLNHEMRPHGSR